MTTWTVPGYVLRVVDGDTVLLLLDLGWKITLEARCRLIGINAPELSDPAGIEARAFAESLLPKGGLVLFTSRRLDKYGRPLGSITDADGQDFGEQMKAAGFAREAKE